jgi:hypothetical protein
MRWTPKQRPRPELGAEQTEFLFALLPVRDPLTGTWFWLETVVVTKVYASHGKCVAKGIWMECLGWEIRTISPLPYRPVKGKA